LVWLAWGLAFLAGGVPAARTAWETLRTERKLDVDLLMVVAALGAASVGQAGDGAILLFLFSLSNTLQDWAMGRARNAVHALMALNPETATLIDASGAERVVRASTLVPGDDVVIRPGERFPADALVVNGYSSVDESTLTGESVPVEKAPGSPVYGGTLNGEGVLRARVERVAGESALARLVRLVEEAQAAQSPTEEFAARLEGPYTIAVLASVPVVFGALLLMGYDGALSWYRAMTFLVVASPCAVVISTPAAVLSAMAAGARAGTLFKSGAALEALAGARTFAFDKTGTLTHGVMELVRVESFGADPAEVLALAAGLERHSEHPIAQAIVKAHDGELPEVHGVRAVPGQGIVGELEGGTPIWAGRRSLALESGVALGDEVERELSAWEEEGFTTVLLGSADRIIAIFGVADTPRHEARPALDALRARGARIVLLTGDREAVARHVARDLGITEIRAELLPGDKLVAIRELQRQGRVAMVGDGVNDAPALTAADVGVAMGAGSDVSLESADLVLMKNDLGRLAGAYDLARATARTIRFNLAFALGIIVVVGLLALLGRVPLPAGVVAHEGGTIFVVLVGLRLLGHRVRGVRGVAPEVRTSEANPEPALTPPAA
jgi:Cd2+/Zn2+-exporting ATPase